MISETEKPDQAAIVLNEYTVEIGHWPDHNEATTKTKTKSTSSKKGKECIYGGACVQDHNYKILKMCKCRGDIDNRRFSWINTPEFEKLNILQARLYTNTLHVYDHVAAKSWHPPPEVAVTIWNVAATFWSSSCRCHATWPHGRMDAGFGRSVSAP